MIDQAIEAELERFYLQYDIPRTLPEFGAGLHEFVMRPSRRLRPLLFLTVLESYGVTPQQEGLAVAAAIELLHSCALLHDDLVDNAQTRRGAAAFHRAASPGVGQAVLGGDLLYTFAVRILLGTQPDPRRHRALGHILEIAAITSLAQFEEMHFIPQTTPADAIERIMELYDRKSGLYTFVAPIELALIFAGGPEGDRQLLRAIGIHLGRAYQLRDDVIDIGSLADAIETATNAPPWELNLSYAILANAPQTAGSIAAVTGREQVIAAILELLKERSVRGLLRQATDELIADQVRAARSNIAGLSIAAKIEAVLETITAYTEVHHGEA